MNKKNTVTPTLACKHLNTISKFLIKILKMMTVNRIKPDESL